MGLLVGPFLLLSMQCSYAGHGEARTATASFFVCGLTGDWPVGDEIGKEINRKLQFWTRSDAFQKILLTELWPMRENENRACRRSEQAYRT
jgi:hypothetical protein